MANHLTARLDSRLTARLVNRRDLIYSAGPDETRDRPAHVRSGSGLCWFNERLHILQDDANFFARLDSAGKVDALELPPGADGKRLFDDTRGNKHHKLDLEACLSAVVDNSEVLIAFGSGSTEARERIAIVRQQPDGLTDVRLTPAPELYARLRETTDFSGSELNIEGAVLLPSGRLRLFQRGNGAPVGKLSPIDATGDLRFSEVWSYLEGHGQPPPLRNIVQYDLGRIGSVPLTFTDAAVVSPMTENATKTFYLAAAEDSPDTVRDGEVCGAALGVIEASDVRWTHLVDGEGVPLAIKAEGLLFHPGDARKGFVVIDSDCPDEPSELCEIELEGPW